MSLKNKIMDTAYKQFADKSFEHTTIEAIIEEVGCSKGGFYHHFKSKEEILNMLIEDYLNEIEHYFNQIPQVKGNSSIEQFNSVYEYITAYKIKQSTDWNDLSKMFSFSNNQRVIRNIEKKFKDIVTVTYDRIIKQGSESGEFSLVYPEIAAEYCTRQLLWIYEVVSKMFLAESDGNELEELIDYSEAAISGILGVDKGCITFRKETMAYKEVILAFAKRRRQDD